MNETKNVRPDFEEWEGPAFAWWGPYVLKKSNRILAKIKCKYWVRTHKYGIEIPGKIN